ncbi:MAG: hypothetical protein WBV23_08915 [Desulfobaccales bacterium]
MLTTTPSSSRTHGLASLGIAALFLVIPVVLFWRPYFFYMLDDWTSLIHMVQYPFGQYLISPDGEQWFPVFYLAFYGLVKLAGERYYLLVLVNCLGTGVTTWLLYCFLKRHFRTGVSLVLSLLYASAALHHAIAWNSFYLCYLMSLGFFLGGLLLTDSYLKAPSYARLMGIGVCALLSILSHNFTLLGLLAYPLYALLARDDATRHFKALLVTVGIVYLLFTWGYLTFPGLKATASHNPRVLTALPGLGYLGHMLAGAFLAPFFYLFWGYYHFPVWAIVAGVSLLGICLALIWLAGNQRQRRWLLWILLLNLLPFVLLSLTRYQKSFNQAFVARYGIFTLIGALLLLGTAWSLIAPRIPARPWGRILLGGLLACMLAGQLLSLPRWQKKYREISRWSEQCYREFNRPEGGTDFPVEAFGKFCPGAYPQLTRSQMQAIHRFLTKP